MDSNDLAEGFTDSDVAAEQAEEFSSGMVIDWLALILREPS